MAGFQITEIIDVGNGWNKVRLADGNIYTLEGNYNWRSNNPGNIEYGPFAASMGAIGSGAPPPGRQRGFAIFPTYEDGQRAREALQFEHPNYSRLTVRQAIARYAPDFENDVDAYVRAVTRDTGISPDAVMSDLSPQQRALFLKAQEAHEGWKEGAIRNADGIRLPPAEIPNVVASQLDVTQNPNVPRGVDGAAPLAYTDPRTGSLYQGVEPPMPEMRQGLLDMLKEGPPQRVLLPKLAAEAPPAAAPVPADRPASRDGLLSMLVGNAEPEAAPPVVPRPPAWAIEAPAVAMARNSIPAADLLASTRNDQITPWMQKDLGGITDVADFLFGKEMTTSLDPIAPAPMPVAAPAAQPSPAPAAPASAQQLSPSQLAAIYQQGGPTRPLVSSPDASRAATPAQMLIAGSGAPWSAADGPATRPRPQPAPTSAPSGLGSTAPQEGLGNVANAGGQLIESATPGFFRIDGPGGAGSVAMPRDVRPNVTVPGFAPVERRPDQNAPLLMPEYQELQDFFGIEPKADYPNPIRSVADMEASQRKPTLSQPLSPNQGSTFAGQERGPAFKTVMKEERIENPEYKVWQANQTALTSSVPLGERTFSTSRDSKDARLAGEAFAANNMPQQWITRQVPTRVPVAQPSTRAPTQVAPVRPATPVVVPLAGTPQAQPRGLFDMLAPTSGPLAAILGLAQRQPVQVAQGHVGGGSHAFAVGPNGITAVTLNSGGNSAFDAANHSGQNMDVYRANREAMGGPITQTSINSAQSSGKTLFRG